MRSALAVLLILSGGVACEPGVPANPESSRAVPVAGSEQRLNQVDILFVIDDSPSTSPKQAELRARFPQLVAILNDLAAQGTPVSYHIGVVGTDLGAGAYIDTNCKPGGLGGKLQRVGREAAVGCAGPSDNFIVYDQITGTNNLPPGKTLEETFGCMASVGDNGCGFEQVLESAYRALHDDIPENSGFRRDDALLVVIILTDEDDCSADDSSDVFSAPVAQPPDGIGYRRSYRCTRFGVAFDGPNGSELMPYGSSGGPVRNPHPATAADGAKLIDVDKYIHFFKSPKVSGGALTDPSRLILASIAGPATPVEALLVNPNTALEYTECTGPISETCQPTVNRSCVNGVFFADPAVRIDAVVKAMPSPNQVTESVCASSYQSALERIGQQIVVAVSGVRCIDGVFDDPAAPDCTVEDVTNGVPVAVPACTGDTPGPCWRLATRPSNQCAGLCAHAGEPAQRYVIEVVRSAPAPTGTTTQASCTVRSVSSPAPLCAD